MSIKDRAMQGGGVVAANHIVGAVVTVVSAVLLSKALGPQAFAVYALCTSLSGVSRVCSRLGVNACLLSQKNDPDEKEYHVALTVMLVASAVVSLATIAVLPLLGHFSRIPSLFWPGVYTVLILPLHVLSLPALTRLERTLRFTPVVVNELASQVLGQAVGIALAFMGWGVWGPLTGWLVRSLFCAVVSWWAVRLLPRLDWDRDSAWRMVRFGFGFVMATAAQQSRNVVLLSVVGRVLGQEAVGHMGLTLRAVGLIAPFRAAVARVILPALAPIAHIPETLRKSVHAVVETELLLSVPVTVVAVAIYPLVGHLLGPSWQPTVLLFQWVAAGSLLSSVHAASLSSLHVRGYFIESITSTCIGILALVVALHVLASFSGNEGGAMALTIVWPTCWFQEWLAHRRVGTTWSRNGVAWAVAGASACLVWRFGPWMLLIPSIVVAGSLSAITYRARTVLEVVMSCLPVARPPQA